MRNWLKVFKFTLNQALKGTKYTMSTVMVGIVVLLVTALTNIFVSGAFDDDAKVNELKAVYVINETGLSIDTKSFIDKHKDDYPYLDISEVSGIDAKAAVSDSSLLGDNANYSIVLEIKEDEENCNLTVYIPNASNIGSEDAEGFCKDFEETIENAKIKSTGVSEDKLNMAIGDLRAKVVEAEEADEKEELSFFSYAAPTVVILLLYFLVIIYGQSIGQVVSMEKTSKLMEYLLTLTGSSGIIFGKVIAIFCEAVIQLFVWLLCGATGYVISNVFIVNIAGNRGKDIISTFVNMLPEGSISHNFVVIMILTVLAFLAAFLFYCFVSALYASFAATAEELNQTNAMSMMTMLVGFFAAMYVPGITDNSKLGLAIIRIIPVSAAFVLPGDLFAGKIGLAEFLVYILLLLFFTVMLAILTGRVYKNRLFKKGTKGIFAEIVAAITGKDTIKSDDSEAVENELSDSEKIVQSVYYERVDKAKKTYTVIGFALLTLVLGANILGGFVGNVIASMVSAREQMDLMAVYGDKTYFAIINIVSMYIIACPLCAFVMKLTNDSVAKVKGHVTGSQYIRSIFAIFPITAALSYFSDFVAAIVSGGKAENTFVGSMVTGESVLTMIMVAVLAPIFEELVFRKLIIDRARRYGELTAIIFSALAFGLFHCNIYQFFYAFAIGLILGYIYVRSGNIYLTIIMHMIVNASSSVLYPLAPEIYKYFSYTMYVLGVISIIYTLIKRDIKFEQARDEVSMNELSSLAFFNIGSVLFGVVCVFLMIYSLLAPLV
ncbi:CPBP family glutamic-type intramembrane protease [Butyrivibrio sp. YAB3001]|uniref:CPBP family glutamic-type intramembrane protease n=1 Tax=Butyrivibrio sp. YAB3001 TaxID=1520812 RepID=UPI0008F66AC4|nr:CPBP family glutamic-type intramembrane protease [Butyrivibrio sp. YAB3001]SFD03881.1 ABC-type Na+ efflux pump, permease component [Butyrivibrio sp. YAB3001]